MNNIYLEFLIEDQSAKILIDKIMEKYSRKRHTTQINYRLHSFKGIGKLPKLDGNVSQIKTGKLLNDLPGYLKGLDRSLSEMGQFRKAIFVVVDNDRRDCRQLKQELFQLVKSLGLDIEVYCCIAIEEIEAWLLGDYDAIQTAFPEVKRTVFQAYRQDDIVGTWEVLADAIYKGGAAQLKKSATGYYEIGRWKCECAEQIGVHLNIDANRSPSFQYFISKLNTFCTRP